MALVQPNFHIHIYFPFMERIFYRHFVVMGIMNGSHGVGDFKFLYYELFKCYVQIYDTLRTFKYHHESFLMTRFLNFGPHSTSKRTHTMVLLYMLVYFIHAGVFIYKLM